MWLITYTTHGLNVDSHTKTVASDFSPAEFLLRFARHAKAQHSRESFHLDFAINYPWVSALPWNKQTLSSDELYGLHKRLGLSAEGDEEFEDDDEVVPGWEADDIETDSW